MCFPAVKWLNVAKLLLSEWTSNRKSFTSLDFKMSLRELNPKENIVQSNVGLFLRHAYKEGMMSGYKSISEHNHLRYRPLTLWEKVQAFFKR